MHLREPLKNVRTTAVVYRPQTLQSERRYNKNSLLQLKPRYNVVIFWARKNDSNLYGL